MGNTTLRKADIEGQWVLTYDEIKPMGMFHSAMFTWDDERYEPQSLGFHSQSQEDVVGYLQERGFQLVEDAMNTMFEFHIFFSHPQDMFDEVTEVVAGHFDAFNATRGAGFWKGNREESVEIFLLTEEDEEAKVRAVAREIADKFHQEAVLVTKKKTEAFFEEGRGF